MGLPITFARSACLRKRPHPRAVTLRLTLQRRKSGRGQAHPGAPQHPRFSAGPALICFSLKNTVPRSWPMLMPYRVSPPGSPVTVKS